ncbi:MAG: DUF4340 domain-containing protein [Lachnospiraceae bacterium]|nr:DUF4340 domain-containing protein [Lachnospiraceae bacterium]
MEKQKKQLLLMAFLLIVAILAFVGISAIPEEEEEEAVTYQITDMATDSVTKLVYTFDDVHVKLAKSGEEWLNDEDKSMDLDEAAVEDMIDRVASLTSEDKIENVEDASIYGLDAATKNVLISDGTTTYTLVIGDYNDLTSTYYVCLEDDMSTVYTANSTTVNAFNTAVEELIVEEGTTTEVATEATTEEVVEETATEVELENVTE